MQKKIRVVVGGTSASKTISILLYLIHLAQSDKTPTLTSVVSESIPHLKRGAIRDFKNIMKGHNYWKDSLWNTTDSVYTFETGSQLEFFSTDNGDKLRGARRDRLFMNEANNCTLDAFDQLEVRTKEFVYVDYNPTNEFWIYTDVMPIRTDWEMVTLTYKDNEALSKEIVDSIEQRKNRKGWWLVYGLGKLGEVEGKIYKDWAIIDEIPHEARLERFGLDFGYSNDPSSIVAVYYYNGGYILDEILYQKGMSNKQLADTILAQEKKVLTIADSAEPKSINEIHLYGVTITGADKGVSKEGISSVNYGIQLVQDQRISMTKRSVNIIREYRNYLWDTDKNGKILNVPEHTFSHCFCGDTLVHTIEGNVKIRELVGKEGYLFTRDGKIERFYSVVPTRTNAEVITIEFEDGSITTVTPDHLLLKPDGEWIEAGLLSTSDMIQCGIYDTKTNIPWLYVLQIQGLKVLQRIREWQKVVAPQIYMDSRKRRNTSTLSRTSHRWGQFKQLYKKLGVCSQSKTSFRTHDTRKERETKDLGRKNTSTYTEVAQVKRGQEVALITWKESLRNESTLGERVLSLPQKIHNYAVRTISKILSSELQNESKTKKVKRITRGRRGITYNLEVSNTHCLVVDGGIVAHNSMDAIRYALTSLVTFETKIKQPQVVPILDSKYDGTIPVTTTPTHAKPTMNSDGTMTFS